MSATRLLNRIVPISLIGFIFGLSLNLVIAQTPATPEEIYLLQNNQLKKLDAVTLNQEIIITEIMPPVCVKGNETTSCWNLSKV